MVALTRIFTQTVTFYLSITLASASYVLHEKRHASPAGWTRAHRLRSDKVLPLRIGLKQSNVHQLEELLMAVSHPKSSTYGQHWSADAIVDYFAPSRASVGAVTEWLAEEGGIGSHRVRLTPDKTWLDVVGGATVGEMEHLLKAEYHIWRHDSGAETVGCHEYFVPQHMQEHVDVIMPTVNLSPPKARSHLRRSVLPEKSQGALVRPLPGASSLHLPVSAPLLHPTSIDNCDLAITPACLQALYNFAGVQPAETANNSFGVVEFSPLSHVQTDLDMFFGQFVPTMTSKSPTLVSIDGGLPQTTDETSSLNLEPDLDLQYSMTLVNPQPVQLLQIGEPFEGAGFDNWLAAVDSSYCAGDEPLLPSCGIVKPPNVVSVSYFQVEVDFSKAAMIRQCNEYGKLGLAGTTVLYCTADNGVAGGSFGEPVCLFPDGTQASGPNSAATRFNPVFPASCPFVTAVGATQIPVGGSANAPEEAASAFFFSGGGFSDTFAMPDYQKDAVNQFLEQNPPPYSSEQFNQSGSRAYPDISANGVNYTVAIDGGWETVFGTSAATPVWGSIITLINDARIQAGKGPVGFINPAIYSSDFDSALNDITTGSNPGCGTQGFPATPGWDPVTGRGTPNFQRLKELWLNLP